MKSGLLARVFSAFCLTVLVSSGVWAADPPAAPNAGRIPTEGATVATSYPVFSWDAVAGADSYDITILKGDGSGWGSLRAVVGNSWNYPANLTPLTPGASFKWRIRSRTAGGLVSTYSSDITFGVLALAAPSTDRIPADGATDASTRPIFSWGAVAGADGYDITILKGDGSGWGSASSVATPWTYPSNWTALSVGAAYKWKVRSRTTGGLRSLYSSEFTFTVQETIQDTAAPMISAAQPADGTWVKTVTPVISATFNDPAPSSGINVASVVVKVDNTPVSAQVTAGGFTYTPANLTQGSHTVSVSVADNAGHIGTANRSFSVDSVLPNVTDQTPADGSSLSTVRPTISASFTDATSGVDAASIHVFLGANEITTQANVTANGFSYTPPSDLALGSHVVQVHLSDVAGHPAQIEWAFTIIPPDTVAPAAVTDLAAGNPYATGFTVAFTAMGDDETVGTASLYDLRASTTPLTEQNWAAALQLWGEPRPKTAGGAESFTVQNAAPDTVYYVGLKVVDEAGNTSPRSNVITVKTADVEAPSSVQDLTATVLYASPTKASVAGATASSSLDSARAPAKAIDGDENTYWSSALSNSYYPEETLTLDLGAPKMVAQLRLLPTNIAPGLFPSQFSIETSSDGYTWSTVSSENDYYAVENIWYEKSFSPQTVRYVRLRGRVRLDYATIFYCIRVAEFEVLTTHLVARLNWSAPGDNFEQGSAAQYDIRWSTEPLTEETWASASQIDVEPAPAAFRTAQTMDVPVSSLPPETKVYFGLKAADEVPFWNSVGNAPFVFTPGVAPAQVTTLAVSEPVGNGFRVGFTAVGDDGTEGTATVYDVRCSSTALTESNWATATQLTGESDPQAAGTPESFAVVGASSDVTCYVGVKVRDELGNESPLSNVVTIKTVDILPPAAIATLSATLGTVKLTAVSATASSQYVGGNYPPSKVIDGSINTLWYSALQPTAGEETLTLDLGATKPIARVRLMPPTYYTLYFPSQFVIELSTDGTTWTTVAQETNYTAVNLTWYDKSFTPTMSRYVRMRGQRQMVSPVVYFIGASEFEAYERSLQQAILTWTAPGDNGTQGTAAGYLARYSDSSPIADETAWAAATPITVGLPTPAVAGTQQSMTVSISGFTAGTLVHFGIRAQDEVPNVSPIGNSASLRIPWNYTDTTPPVVSNLVPFNGLTVETARPTFSASFSDPAPGYGVDASSVRLTLQTPVKTVDVTLSATIDANGFTFTPTADLGEGNYTLTVAVSDLAGNQAIASTQIHVQLGPVVSGMQPVANVWVKTAQPVISASFSDSDGINPASVGLTLNGAPKTPNVVDANGFSYTPTAPGLQDGPVTVEVTVADVLGKVFTASWTFNVDTLAPVISSLAPADGSSIQESQPVIGAAFTDPLPPGATEPSGVAPTSIVVTLDGVDVTELCGRSETGFSYVPRDGLSAGTHAVSVSVRDNGGNTSTAAWSFTVTDVEPPVISGLYPFDGALIVNPKPRITASFCDSGTAVNPATAQILLDGVDVSSGATVTTEGFAFTPLTDLALGAHTLKIHVADTVGNLATATSSFEVVAPVLSYWEEKVLSVSVHGEIPPGSDVAEIQAVVTAVDFGTPEGIEVRTAVDLATGSYSVLFRKIGFCNTFTARFRFLDKVGILGLPTSKQFSFSGLGGGGDSTGKPPAPPTIVGFEVVGGLTGDEKDDSVSPKLRLTKKKAITVQVEVNAAPGTSIQRVEVSGSGPSSISRSGQCGGFFTVELGELTEGEYLLSAVAVAVKGSLTSSALLDADKELALQADFTKPELAYTFPLRRSYKDDKDIIFLNGNSAADNAIFRQHNNNFYAPGELLGHAEIVEAFSGLSRKDANKPQVTVVGPGGGRSELTTTVTPATGQEPAKIDVAAVPNNLPESVTMDGIAIASYNGRAGYHVRLTDRCGNELDTEQLSETDEEESLLLERNAFRMWVDRTPPDAENGQNKWHRFKVEPIGKQDSVFMGPKAYYVVSSCDAAEGWQESELLSNWLVKAYRTPAMLPKDAEMGIASQEFSPWLLKTPVSMPKEAPSVDPGRVRVRMRDLAGNISNWIELTGWQDPNFNRAQGSADPAPQKLEHGRTITPAIMTISPSFEDPPRSQPFSMTHIDVDELDDENDDGYVDVLNEPDATLNYSSGPAIGVAPTEYVYTVISSVPYGYTDLLNFPDVYGMGYQTSPGVLWGTIWGTRWTIGGGLYGGLNGRVPDRGWDFREGDAGWARMVNSYIHTGYHYTNAVKLRPDVVATGNVVTLRVSGGFVDPNNPAVSGLIQTVSVGGSKVAVLALPDATKWDYVKFMGPGGMLNGDPNETDPAVRAQKITILKDEQGKLRQRLLWGEKDGGNGSVVQTIEMDVEVGSQVPAQLYDVQIGLGNLQHTMSNALDVATIQITGLDGTDIGRTTVMSDPRPLVLLDNVSQGDVQTFGDTAVLNIAGSVYDTIADITEGGAADIKEVIIGSDSVPVEKVDDDRPADPVRRPYGFRGRFSCSVRRALASGANNIVVEARNVLGNSGFDSVTVAAAVEANIGGESAGSSGCFLQTRASISIPTELRVDQPDTIELRTNAEDLSQRPDILTETEANSLVFEGNAMSVTLVALPALDPLAVDSLPASIWIGAPVSESPLQFTETGPNTRIFLLASTQLRVEYNPASNGTIKAYLGTAPADPENCVLQRTAVSPLTYSGTTTELGTATIVLYTPEYISPAVCDSVNAKLTAPNVNANERFFSLVETGVNSCLFESTGLGFSVGGESEMTPISLRETNISVTNNEGTTEGVCQPLVVRIKDVGRPALTSAQFWGQSFDLVSKDGGIPHFDRPLLITSKLPPAGIKNVRGAQEVRTAADLRVSADPIQRNFAAGCMTLAINQMPGTTATKIARGTQLSLYYRHAGVWELDHNNKEFPITVELWNDEKDKPAVSITNVVTYTPAFFFACLEPPMKMDVAISNKAALGFRRLRVTQRGTEWINISMALEVVNLKVAFVGIDGMNATLFREAVSATGNARNFKRILGTDMKNARTPYWGDGLNSFPTITYCNWATVFTGVEPKAHGQTGNSFFARDVDNTRPFLSCNSIWADKNQILQTVGVVVPGGAGLGLDPNLRTQDKGVTTVFERLKVQDKTITMRSVAHYVARGLDPASEVTRFPYQRYKKVKAVRAISVASPVVGGAMASSDLYKGYLLAKHSAEAAVNLDISASELTLEFWEPSKELPDATFIYFPGPDNVGHAEGRAKDTNTGFPQSESRSLEVTKQHFEKTTDPEFGKLLDSIDAVGYMAATVFVIVSDHGLTGADMRAGLTTQGYPLKTLKTAKVYQTQDEDDVDELKAIFDAVMVEEDGTVKQPFKDKTFIPKEQRLNFCRVVYSPNGGMAHIYIRPETLWEDAPDFDKDVFPLARKLFLENLCGKEGLMHDSLKSFEGALGFWQYVDGKAGGEQPAILVRWREKGDKYHVFAFDRETNKESFLDLSELLPGRKDWTAVSERILQDLDDGFVYGNSRSGDIILIFNVREGFNCANKDEVYAGWHGAPNIAESRVPIIASFLGNTRFIDDAMAKTFGYNEARLSEVAHFVEELFERAGRGKRR